MDYSAKNRLNNSRETLNPERRKMRKLKTMLIALLCAVTTVVSLGAVKSITAKADETSDYVYADTSVISVTANADLPGYPRLELTGVDYKVSNGTYNKGKDYATVAGLNTFSKIKIDGVAAGAGYDGTLTDPYLNMFDNSTDRFAFKSDAFTTATEIIIEAGCEFPSFALWSGTGTTVYRTTEDVTFKKVDGMWKKTIVYTYENTSVTGVSVNGDLLSYPRLELDGVDYKNSNGTYNKGKDYATVAGLNTFSKIKIDGVAAGAGYDGTLTDPYLNMFDNSIDRFAFKSDAFVSASEIVIEEGCEFPSYALWSGMGSTVYRTTETCKFKKVNDGWYKVFVATFVDESGNALGASEFTVADETLVYPEIEKEVGYDYTWTGNEIKAENITVTLKKTIKTFDVKMGDGEMKKYNYGAKLEKPEDPEIPAEEGYEKTFKGWFNGETEWNFETDIVTGNLTLTAEFDKKVIEYKAKLTLADRTEKEFSYTIENRSEKLAEVKKFLGTNDARYTYTNDLPTELPLINDATYTETRTVNKYSVTIGDNAPVDIEYGTMLKKPETDPVKEEDDEYTYTFKGWYNGETEWNFETDVVTENVTLVAKFDSVKKETESGSDSGDGSITESGTSEGCFGSAVSGISALSVLVVVCAAILIKKKEN